MPSSFVRNSLVNAVAGVFTTLGGFLGTILVARLLGVQGTGIVAFATWAVTVAVIVSDLGLTGCLPRFIPELHGNGDCEAADRLTWRLFTVFVVYVASLCAAFFVYAAWLAWNAPGTVDWSVTTANYTSSPTFWLLVGIAIFVQALGNFTTSWIKGVQDFGMLARAALASCIFQGIATALGVMFFGVTGALAALAAGAAMPVLLLFQIPRDRGALPDALRRRVTRFSLETWGSYMLTAFFASRMEVFFLDRSWGSHAVGLFTVSLTLSNLATQGPLLLTGALLPRLSDHLGRNEADRAREVYASSVVLMALLVFPACLGTAAIAPVLLPLIYGPSFGPAVQSATILLGTSAFAATCSVASVYLVAVERTRFLLATAVGGAALSILVGLTLVPAFGPVAAACGRGAVQTIIAACGLWYMYRHLRCPTPLRVLAKLLAAAAICAAAARLTVMMMPNALGVTAAIAVGALTYAAAIRLINPLTQRDTDKLRLAVSTLPRPLRPAATAGLQLIWS